MSSTEDVFQEDIFKDERSRQSQNMYDMSLTNEVFQEDRFKEEK